MTGYDEAIESLAKELCEAYGFSWDRLGETHESALNEFQSRARFRAQARAEYAARQPHPRSP